MCEVRWDQIRVSPFQPRRHISEQELEELAASIAAVGLIHPPVVRTVMQGQTLLYYELIAGERRWRAAKRAGLDPLPVIIRPASDEEAARSALIENIQRVDLNPLEMAESFRKLLEIFQLTQEEIADKVGKKRSTVANYLRLLSLPVTIRESLIAGAITMGHAKAILALDSFELKEQLHRKIVTHKLTVRESEKESVRLGSAKERKKREHSPAALHVAEVEERLTRHFGTKVVLQHGKEGKILLHYYSLDDLDRLMTLIFS